jgi:hypothetical protein
MPSSGARLPENIRRHFSPPSLKLITEVITGASDSFNPGTSRQEGSPGLPDGMFLVQTDASEQAKQTYSN